MTFRDAARQPKPFAVAPPPPDLPFSLGRLGPWSILGRDALGKRAVAQCSHCREVKEISLVGDTPPSCGCSASRLIRQSAFDQVSFVPGLRRART
jgi:hypothetical protein